MAIGSPPSQKFRTIGFTLTGGSSPALTFTFSLRPEDLRRPEPSRTSVQQTLGGGLIDSFGAGISTITLSGHNGWRGGLLSSGESLFADLRAAVFTEYHARRQKQVEAGNDPNEIELTMVDTLDNFSLRVTPMLFSLQRSKSSPLLMRYQIELTVVGDATQGDGESDSILSALSNPLRWLASVTGLGNVLTELQAGLSYVQNVYAQVQSYVGAAMDIALGVLGGLQTLVSLASPGGLLGGALAPFLSSALAVSGGMANAFHALAAQPGLTNQQRLPLMAIASNFSDANCTISNGFAIGQVFRSFRDMEGASNCSSTGGGSPVSAFTLAGTSPFPSIFATTPSNLSITFAAQQALGVLQGDPLLLAANPAVVANAMAAVGSGIAVAPTTALIASAAANQPAAA